MKITDAMLTDWFPMHTQPVRAGEYEGREKSTGYPMKVFWRRLEDTDYEDWYVFKGVLGPFKLWECVSHKLSGWRGLKEKYTGEGKND